MFKSYLMGFLKYGFTHRFPIEPGPLARGISTTHPAPILNEEMIPHDLFVWPEEVQRGQRILPIDPKAVDAAREDEAWYDALALLASIRVGKGREKELAVQKLKKINQEVALYLEPLFEVSKTAEDDLARGIVRNRMVAKGVGESRLLNRCSNGVACSLVDHQAKRRTEEMIIKI